MSPKGKLMSNDAKAFLMYLRLSFPPKEWDLLSFITIKGIPSSCNAPRRRR
jgi:hypothetical protein